MQNYHKKLEINFQPYWKKEFNSSVFKSSTDVGRANLFKMDIPTTGLPMACTPYPITLEYQKFIVKEIHLLEDAGFISKNLSLLVVPVIIVPKMPDPLHPKK